MSLDHRSPSICKPVGRKPVSTFPALTYYGERAADRVAYITLFPIGSAMRANFMVYRDMNDPWLRDMRQRPTLTLFATDAGSAQAHRPMRRSSGRSRSGRPISTSCTDHLQPGVVLVGDAFGTSCPAAGTGTSKVFTDVERLCNVHVPQWFATGGMGADKIAAFYDDPVKNACDRHSFDKAFNLRSISIDEGPVLASAPLEPLPRSASPSARRVRSDEAPTPVRPDAPAGERAGAELSLHQR